MADSTELTLGYGVNGRWKLFDDYDPCIIFQANDTKYIVHMSIRHLRINKYLSDMPHGDKWIPLRISNDFMTTAIEVYNLLQKDVTNIDEMYKCMNKEELLINYCKKDCFDYDYLYIKELLTSGRLIEAENELKLCILYNKSVNYAYFDLAKIYAIHGNDEEAIRCIKKSRKYNWIAVIVDKEFERIRDRKEIVDAIEMEVYCTSPQQNIEYWKTRKEYTNVIYEYVERHHLDHKVPLLIRYVANDELQHDKDFSKLYKFGIFGNYDKNTLCKCNRTKDDCRCVSW